MTTVGVRFKADTAEIVKPVEALKGVAAKTAATIEHELDDAFDTVERSAQGAGAKVKRAGDQASKSWADGIAPIKGLSGAVFGGMAGDAFDAAEAIGSADGRIAAMGLTLGAIAIAGVGLYEVANGLRDIADGALEARDRLREAGAEAVIAPAALASLDQYEASQTRLASSLDLAAIAFTAEFTPALIQADEWMILAAGHAGELGRGLAKMASESNPGVQLLSANVGVLVGELNPGVDLLRRGAGALWDWAAGTDAAAADTGALAVATATLTARDADLALQLNATLDAERRTREEEALLYQARTAAAAVTTARAEGERRLAGDLRRSAEAVSTLRAELREEAKAEREAQIAMGEVAEANRVYAVAARDAATYGQVVLAQMEASPAAALTFSESMGVAAAAMQRTQRFTSAFGDAAAGVLQATQGAFEGFAAARTRQIGRLEEANERLRASREDATTDELRQIDRQIEANNRAIAAKEAARRADNRRAKKAFSASQATQIAMATANTAAAVTAGFAPPPLGAGPIGGAILAAPLAASLGAQIAIIARQKYTPSFAGGGLVASRLSSTPQDHVPILADPREGIVSPRGMAGLGEDGLDAINRGQPVGGGNIHLTAQLVLDRRVVGEVLTKVGGRSATRTGRLPVHT